MSLPQRIKILSDSIGRLEQLEHTINVYMNDGWKLVGQPVVAPHDKQHVYIATLCKEVGYFDPIDMSDPEMPSTESYA